jgi:hypothetical protein
MRCECFYLDVHQDTITDETPDGVCDCGHMPDEHDDLGECIAEVEAL